MDDRLDDLDQLRHPVERLDEHCVAGLGKLRPFELSNERVVALARALEDLLVACADCVEPESAQIAPSSRIASIRAGS